MSTATSWWWAGLTEDHMLLWAAVACACLAGIVLCIRALRAVHRAQNQPAGRLSLLQKILRLAHDGDGTASLEFAMVAPILLTILLLLAQTTMLMGGNLFVNYAAFAATRTAIVVIPENWSSDEPANMIEAHPGSFKFERIRASAALAVTPVCGRSEQEDSPADAVVQGLNAMYAAYDRDPPPWVENLAGPRIRYAFARTKIKIYRSVVENASNVRLVDKAEDFEPFGPREAVTVRVRHELNLGVPIVWITFADDSDAGRYTVIDANYTLTNEGVVNALPERPTLPRRVP